MSKCDITIEKSLTINTGNYSSMKPSVTLTLKDVDVGSLKEQYTNLSNVAHGLLLLEIKDTFEIGNDGIEAGGVKAYAKVIGMSEENIEKGIEDCINRLGIDDIADI
jgi:hypothetical protein